MSNLIFVYGTLLIGEDLHHHLEEATFLKDATTFPVYTLINIGGFPGLLDRGTTRIFGELYEVNAETLRRLDALEGHPSFYRRMPVAINWWEGAEAYFLLPHFENFRYPVIPGGSWRNR